MLGSSTTEDLTYMRENMHLFQLIMNIIQLFNYPIRKLVHCNSFRTEITSIVNCPNMYYVGLCKFNTIHAQLRMKCSKLYAHLHSLHVIDSPACVCSHRVGDTTHIFWTVLFVMSKD